MSSGGNYHVVPYKIEKPTYLETGCAETVCKRDGEWAIRSFAIQRSFSVLCGKYDEGSWFRFDGSQAASQRACGDRSLHLGQERIAATSVHDDHAKSFGGIDR